MPSRGQLSAHRLQRNEEFAEFFDPHPHINTDSVRKYTTVDHDRQTF